MSQPEPEINSDDGGLRKLRLPRVRLDLEHVRDGATPVHRLGFHIERDEEGYLVCFIHNELRTLGFFMVCVAAIVAIVVLIAHGSLHMLDMDDIQVRACGEWCAHSLAAYLVMKAPFRHSRFRHAVFC